MSTEDSIDKDQTDTATITFQGKDHLTKAVVEGSLRYFIGEYGLFILFLMDEAEGFSVCYARGFEGHEPSGDSLERLMTLETLEQAQNVFAKLQELATAALKQTLTLNSN